MDPRPVPSQRLDHLDAERFRDMLASPPFAIFRKRIELLLDRSRGDCEKHDDPRDIHRAQGSTAAIRSVLALPEQILREIEKRK